MTQVIVAARLVTLAMILSRVGRLGLERELAVAALRAAVQLAAVGALIALVFEHTGLAAGFVALMLATATFTSARRLRGVPGTFVGLVLGGASPAEAARVQLVVVLLRLLAVEVVAALAAARLVVAGLTAPGERVVPPRATRPGCCRSAGSRRRSRPPP